MGVLVMIVMEDDRHYTSGSELGMLLPLPGDIWQDLFVTKEKGSLVLASIG